MYDVFSFARSLHLRKIKNAGTKCSYIFIPRVNAWLLLMDKCCSNYNILLENGTNTVFHAFYHNK